MNDSESIKLVELALAWVEHRSALRAEQTSLSIRSTADGVENALEALIAEGERDVSERLAGVHKTLQSIARGNRRGCAGNGCTLVMDEGVSTIVHATGCVLGRG